MKMHHKKNFFYNLKGITGLFRYYRFIFQIHPSTLPITFLGLLRGIKIYQIWPYKLYFYRQWVRCPGCAIMETNDDFFVKWHDLARTKFRSFRFLADTDWGTGSFREVYYPHFLHITNQYHTHYETLSNPNLLHPYLTYFQLTFHPYLTNILHITHPYITHHLQMFYPDNLPQC